MCKGLTAHYCALTTQAEYLNAVQANTWHRPIEFAGGETIVMHSPAVQVHI